MLSSISHGLRSSNARRQGPYRTHVKDLSSRHLLWECLAPCALLPYTSIFWEEKRLFRVIMGLVPTLEKTLAKALLGHVLQSQFVGLAYQARQGYCVKVHYRA